ncbi:7-deoxyloganetin glucosyltransferase-like protein [Tanacetum coccineum]
MADLSQKWHDRSTSKRVSNDSSAGIAVIINKIYKSSENQEERLREENVHTIKVGCENCGGAHLNKECPLHEEVKSIKEVKYGDFRQTFLNNNENGARYLVGPSGYYTHMDNGPPFNEKKPSLEELMNKHIEENKNASLKNLETHIERLAKDYKAKAANKVQDSSVVLEETEERPQEDLPCQLPPKELNPGSFTLPYTIGSLNFYAMADLGASVNIMPRSMFNHLKLSNLKKTDMLVEMADMTKKVHVGIVENVLVKIDKFLFPSDFMIIDMLGVGDDKIVFDMNGKVHHPVGLVENACMISDVQEEESFNPLEIGNDLFSYESFLCLEFEKHNHLCLTKQNNEDTFVSSDMQEDREGEKGMTKMAAPKTTTPRLHCCRRL